MTEASDPLQGAVLRFPQATCSRAPKKASCPRATLTPTDQSGLNPLEGTGGFVFGATIRMSTVAGKAGMNIMQRGDFGDGEQQWKLQADYHAAFRYRVASCRFADGSGAVLLLGTKRLVAGTWYDLSCLRTGDTFSLVVDQVNGTAADETVSTTAALGGDRADEVRDHRRRRPSRRRVGQTDTSTDQFHGDLDAVFFRRVCQLTPALLGRLRGEGRRRVGSGMSSKVAGTRRTVQWP